MSFKRFDPEDIVISAESVTAPLWVNDATTLTQFFTSSTQIGGATGEYFYDVYHLTPLDTGSRVQFSLAYADKVGSGSAQYNATVLGKSPSSAIYGQYRSLVLGDEESDFTFGGTASDYFYVINIDRSRYKERLLPGTFNIKLTAGTSTLSLIDNSDYIGAITYTDSGRVYEVVSGSLTDGLFSGSNAYGYSNTGSYGKFLPDVGVILLNGAALTTDEANGGIGLTVDRTSSPANSNINYIFDAINVGAYFRAQSEETITSNYVFVRVRNSEFNYSINPSMITGSGELRHSIMINSPQAYITTVGLYNDNNDLLAVAKLSRPLLKDFTKEALVRIKLNY